MKHLLMKLSMHLHDLNDYEYVKRLGYSPIGFLPPPLARDTPITPHVSTFYLGEQQFVSVFHIKPVYYLNRYGCWRPLSEVCTHHGNRRIVIDYHKLDLVHPDFLSWLINPPISSGSIPVVSRCYRCCCCCCLKHASSCRK